MWLIELIACANQQLAKIFPHEDDAMVTGMEASSTTANQMNRAFNCSQQSTWNKYSYQMEQSIWRTPVAQMVLLTVTNVIILSYTTTPILSSSLLMNHVVT